MLHCFYFITCSGPDICFPFHSPQELQYSLYVQCPFAFTLAALFLSPVHNTPVGGGGYLGGTNPPKLHQDAVGCSTELIFKWW